MSDKFPQHLIDAFFNVSRELSAQVKSGLPALANYVKGAVGIVEIQSSTIATLEARVKELENLKFGFPDRSERDWEEDYKHENGQYQCRCGSCGQNFMGHKRRVRCKVCSVGLGLTQSEKKYTRSEMEEMARELLNDAHDAKTPWNDGWIDEWLSKRKEGE